MSESSRRGAGAAGAARPRLVGRRLALVFAATFTGLSGVFLLLSVVPMYAVTGGAGSTGAGIATGSLMLTTVLAELALPRLLVRFGYVPVLAVGLLLLGLPPLALIASSDLAVIVAVSLVRGLGFGVAVVVPNAMVAELAPAARRGEALGLFGVMAGLPTVLALPLGVWLVGKVGYPPVFIAATVVSLAALAILPGLPSRLSSTSPGQRSFGIVQGLRSPDLLRPAVAFGSTAMATGVLITFLPEAVPVAGIAAAALFVQPAVTTLARWQAGRVGDRIGAARLLAPAVLLSAAGIAVLVWVPGTAAVFVSMVLFGVGFGITQNASLAMMYDRVPASGYGTVSAIWNIGYDGGMGIGGVAFGIAAAHTGFPAAFALTAGLILLTVPLAFRRGRRV